MKKIHSTRIFLFVFFALFWSCSKDESVEPKVYNPTMSSFSPTEGIAGTEVIITGFGLGTNVSKNIVKFGEVKAKITMASAKNIWFKVPDSALTNKITVEAYGKKITSILDFEVLTSIFLENEKLNLKVSENRALVPSVFGYDGVTTVSWSSDNENVATVDNQGNVMAIANGTATITATVVEDTSATATCIVTVSPN